jgi:hypothetical protein
MIYGFRLFLTIISLVRDLVVGLNIEAVFLCNVEVWMLGNVPIRSDSSEEMMLLFGTGGVDVVC